MKHETMTADLLRQLISYDPEAGVFRTRVKRRWVSPGDVIGTPNAKNPNAYIRIRIGEKLYYAHRLAWLYVYGQWPKEQVDHRNGIPHDNRLANLREATRAENQQNRAMSNKNTSGATGVHWGSHEKLWRARIKLHGKMIEVGAFANKDDAIKARVKAKAEFHLFQPYEREK